MNSSSIVREKSKTVTTTRTLALLYLLLCLALLCIIFFLHPQISSIPINDHNVLYVKPQLNEFKDCDLSKGHWIPDERGSLYTNFTCPTIPNSKNCLKHGRPNRDFLFWRWKPEGCDLPRFDPKAFLDLVRGKRMNFIGDSLARNHMESLLCLLSMEETPRDIFKDAEDRNRKWYFSDHDFTLSTSWTKFLVAGFERTHANKTGTGIYDLDIDKIDEQWAKDLPNTDIAIVSAGHWLFRPIYIHRGDETIGCIFCNLPNMTQISLKKGFKLIFSAAFKHINACHNCKDNLVTVLRTFSPTHFENGSWNTGGACGRTIPFKVNETDQQRYDMEIRTSQIEQLEEIKRGSLKKKLAVLDVTKAMLMRPDGHPNSYWGNKWMKGFNDCTHWCLPGPIDAWSEFLMALLRQLSYVCYKEKAYILDVTKAMLMRPDGHPNSYWGNKWMKGFNDCTHWCLPGPIDAWSEFLMALLRQLR